MFHTVVQRGFQEAAKDIYFADSLSLFPAVKEFSKIWLTVGG